MNERDRVLDAFRNCITEPKCKDCPWTECETIGHGTIEIPRDLALAVMRELVAQEPRVMTLYEIHDSMVVYLEAGTKFLKLVDDDGVVLAIGGSSCANAKCFITAYNVGVAAMNDEYNVTWRAWSERPTKEQREGTPWDG